MKRSLIALLCAGVFVFACKDKEEPDVKAPTIQINTPEPSSTVWGIVNVKAEVVDERKIKSVEIFIDGTSVKTLTTGTIDEPIDTKMLEEGSHTLKVVAIDETGNQQEQTVTFDVLNYFFKFNVSDNFTIENQTVLFYITTTDGAVIGIQKIENGEVAKFETPDNYAKDQTFVLNKFVHRENPESSIKENSVTAFTGVKPGTYDVTSSVFIDGDIIGQAEAQINNFDGSNTWNEISGEGLVYGYPILIDQNTLISLSLFENDGHVFMNLNEEPTSPGRYVMLEDVDVGDTFNFDFADLSPMEAVHISTGSPLQGRYTFTYGTLVPGDYSYRYEVSVLFDWWFAMESNELLYHTAGNAFPEYLFYSSGYDDMGSYANFNKGTTPAAFERLDANVLSYEKAGGHITLEVNGNSDSKNIYGAKSFPEEQKYNYFSVLTGDESIALTVVVPEEIQAEYDMPAADDIVFYSVSFTEYDNFADYEEYLDWNLTMPITFYEAVDAYQYKNVSLITSGRQKPNNVKDAKKEHEEMRRRVEGRF